MAKQAKSALAAILDKVNQLGTITGGDVLTSTETSLRTEIFHQDNHHLNAVESVIEIDPNTIRNWEYHDRTPEELGDLESLAEELKIVGQVQPCLVRPCVDDSLYKYEIIVGERRWRATKIAGIKLKAIVKTLNDHDAALCQAVENSNRKDLSDYAKGISYSKLVDKDVITQKELQATLKLSQSSIRNLLSFAKIKPEIVDAIKNFTKISSTTAYEISRLQEKGEEYVSVLIELADKLREGKIGHTKIQELIKEKLSKKDATSMNQATPVTTKNGRHIFTWRKDTNGQKSITFPKDIRNLIDYRKVEDILIDEIQGQLYALDAQQK